MKKWNNKQLGIIALVVVGLAVLLSYYITITGFAIQSGNIIEATAHVNVWAKSKINISTQGDTIRTTVLLDNGTEAPNQNVDLYLNDYQSPEFKNKTLFNLSNMSPGTYNLKVIYQGSPLRYINQTSFEEPIEITNKGILIGNITNEITNESSFQNTTQVIPSNCKEFIQQVLWSSGYSNNISSIDYQNWTPEYNCSAAGFSSCTIGSAEIETRFISNMNQNQEGEGYVQISNSSLSSLSCKNPESVDYLKYLAYSSFNGQGHEKEEFCGKNKNPNSECGITLKDNYSGDSCYGIKSFANPEMITDTFQIKYTLCPL